MSEPKFTKGPWIVVDGQFDSDVEITTAGRQENSKNHIFEMDNSICEMDIHFHGCHGVEQRANAHLIAAAPEMYKMLLLMQRNGRKQGWDSKYEDDMDKLSEVLAKAGGEQ